MSHRDPRYGGRLLRTLGICALVAAAALVAALPGLLRDSSPSASTTSGEVTVDDSAFWAALRVGAAHGGSFSSFEDLAAAADTVVLGEPGPVRLDHVFQGDVAIDRLPVAAMELGVTRVLRGAVPEDVVTVELALPGTVAAARERLERGVAPVPSGPVVAFLISSDKLVARARAAGDTIADPAFPNRFQPINDFGFWAETDRAPLDAPLASDRPGQSAFADELRTIDSVTELAESLEPAGP